MNSTEKFDFIINRLSGTVLKKGEAEIKAGLEQSFGDKTGDILFIDGKDITSTMQALVAKNAGTSRGIIIGGGDGTVLTAAEQIMGRSDITLGVLPLGTHNLFARQLGFAIDFKQAAAQYKNSTVADIDVGRVNGMHFLCGLMIDKNSVRFYQAREELRVKKHIPALKNIFALAVNALTGPKETLDVSGKLHTGRVFAVTNNVLTPRPGKADTGNPDPKMAVIENMFAKGDQNDGLLALYAVRGGIHTTALSARVMDGTWTQHKSVSVETAPSMLIAPVSKKAKQKTTIVLDGEIKQTTYPLDVTLLKSALRVYRP